MARLCMMSNNPPERAQQMAPRNWQRQTPLRGACLLTEKLAWSISCSGWLLPPLPWHACAHSLLCHGTLLQSQNPQSPARLTQAQRESRRHQQHPQASFTNTFGHCWASSQLPSPVFHEEQTTTTSQRTNGTRNLLWPSAGRGPG